MRPFPIAGVQMHVHYGQDNIPTMWHKLEVLLLRFPSVEMVVFSELAAFGASMDHAQTLPGPAENQFCEMARKHGVWLIPGSIFERVGDVIYNTASVINPHGVVIGRHRKMFPFTPHEFGVTGGKDFLVWDIEGVARFGVSICYDMWFPETTRTLAAMGAEVILHPTMTDTIDRDVELAISRSSAAMNQCFFFDVNGVGGGGTGRSIVVRPTGTGPRCPDRAGAAAAQDAVAIRRSRRPGAPRPHPHSPPPPPPPSPGTPPSPGRHRAARPLPSAAPAE
jgi:predicted amidohydrolase